MGVLSRPNGGGALGVTALRLFIVLTTLVVLQGTPARAQDMSGYYDRIYQISVVSSNAGSKSSIGSGFQVSADGLIATNYHVISDAVHAPDAHRIEYMDDAGQSGELVLLDFDVVNDLALLRHPQPRPVYFELEVEPITRGATLYALGNPRDMGITLNTGAFNGFLEHSYSRQILFSGSLNPGMSGGPSLLADGRVAGVNVATAGSDLSLLVPATQLQALIDAGRTLIADDYAADTARQILEWQQARFDDLLALDWPVSAFADDVALEEVRHDIQCWGESNEDHEERRVDAVSKQCNAGDQIYLGGGFSTGQIHYSFGHQGTTAVSPLRFHYNQGSGMYPDNEGDDTQLTGFSCQSNFLETLIPANDQAPAGDVRASLCVRAYVNMPGLFDVLVMAIHTTPTTSYRAHYTLAGVSQALSDRFARKFFAALGWREAQ